MRDDPAVVENQHVGGDLLDDFEHMRGVDDHPPLGGEPLHQPAQHQRGRDIEPGVRLVQNDDRGIVQQGGGNQDLLPHALRVRRHRRVHVVLQPEQA